MTTRKVVVLGGDRRELVIAERFRARGNEVLCFGTAPSPPNGQSVADSLAQALRGADVIVTPAPGMAEDTSLYAPHADAPIVLDAEGLATAAPGAQLFAGAVHPAVRTAAEQTGVRCHAFAADDRLQVLHAIPTAEGAIARTVDHYEGTINGSSALIVGYGRIAVILSSYLRAMGASTTVAARRPEIQARATAAGHHAVATTPEALIDVGKDADLIYTTAPAPLVNAEVMAALAPSVLLMDIASPPGGLDHDAAAAAGLHVVWARGQAGTAPTHSGEAQFEVMVETLATVAGGLEANHG